MERRRTRIQSIPGEATIRRAAFTAAMPTVRQAFRDDTDTAANEIGWWPNRFCFGDVR